MGRTRTFDEHEVLARAATAFVAGGYEGTSIDDLVSALDLHRGSLYKAFGSKRGLFVAALRQYVDTQLAGSSSDELVTGDRLDLLLVAALERGHRDPEVAELVERGLDTVERSLGGRRAGGAPTRAVALLGRRLYARLHTTTTLEEVG